MDEDAGYHSDPERYSLWQCIPAVNCDSGISLDNTCSACELLEDCWSMPWEVKGNFEFSNAFSNAVPGFRNNLIYNCILKLCNSFDLLNALCSTQPEPTTAEQRNFWITFEQHLLSLYVIPPLLNPLAFLLDDKKFVIHRKEQPHGTYYLDLTPIHKMHTFVEEYQDL